MRFAIETTSTFRTAYPRSNAYFRDYTVPVQGPLYLSKSEFFALDAGQINELQTFIANSHVTVNVALMVDGSEVEYTLADLDSRTVFVTLLDASSDASGNFTLSNIGASGFDSFFTDCDGGTFDYVVTDESDGNSQAFATALTGSTVGTKRIIVPNADTVKFAWSSNGGDLTVKGYFRLATALS